LETLDGANNNIAVTITDGKIAASDAINASVFVTTSMDGGYSIQAANGKYIGHGSNANGLTASNTALKNTLSINKDGDVNVICSGGAYLRFNASNNNMRFRYYKSTTYTGQKPIALYKLTTPVHSHAYESVITPPTCTEQGYTTYTCACGDSYIADYVAATGHAWDEGVYTDPTTEADGYTTYTCGNCGETKVEVDEGTQITGPVADNALNISGAYIQMGAYIGAQFEVNSVAVAQGGYSKVYVTVNLNGEITTLEENIAGDYKDDYGNQMYAVIFPMISANMTEMLEITAYAEKDGKTFVGPTWTWSVQQGVFERLDAFYPFVNHATYGPTYTNYEKLLVNMLYYGAAAQETFGINTDKLATEGLDEKYLQFKTEGEPALNETNTANGAAVNGIYEYSLGLRDKVDVQMTFHLAAAAYDEYEVKITNGKNVYTYTGEDFTAITGYPKFVYIVFDELMANDMRDEFTVELYRNGTLVSQEYTVSIAGTAKIKKADPSLVTLINAMMNYGDAVAAAFPG